MNKTIFSDHVRTYNTVKYQVTIGVFIKLATYFKSYVGISDFQIHTTIEHYNIKPIVKYNKSVIFMLYF
jgi:hypothetical protein